MVKMHRIEDPALLQYGDIPGYKTFRKDFAEYLSKKYSENVDYKSLFITNGVTGGLSLLCSLFTQKDSIIFVEEPTYFLAINIFKDFKLDIRTISIEKDGLDIDELTAKIKEIRKQGNNDNIFLYTIPTFHNPTSYTMSEKKREQLGNLCNMET